MGRSSRGPLLLLVGLAAAASGADQESRSHGVSPIHAGAERLAAGDCRSCHEAVYREWKGSRHAAAWSNTLFQEGFHVEGAKDRCVFCHAPLDIQFEQVKRGDVAGLAGEGVNCAACHVRDGRIFSPVEKAGYFHGGGVGGASCGSCHQFNFARRLDGGVKVGSLPSQATQAEWEAYSRRGGTGDCLTCHMPGGSHSFRGAHDVDFLKSAIDLSVQREGDDCVFLLRSRNVGHNFPTGDLFRSLTLEVSTSGRRGFRVAAVFGRNHRTEWDDKTLFTRQVLVEDTSLKPFEVRRVVVASAPAVRYRLRYHYTSTFMEIRSSLGQDELVVTLLEGKSD